MPTVVVHNTQGAEAGNLDLAPAVFEAPINTNCVRAAVNRQLARRRQGTVGVKTRGEVNYTSKKPWKQKGTGRARAGTRKSPLWRGGGITFGPQARDYGGMINRKVTRSAILSCLSSYAQDGGLVVVDAFDFAAPRTKEVIAMLGRLQVKPCRVLLLTEGTDVNLALGARNIPWVDVINCDNLNAYDLTTHDVLVASQGAIRRIEETYA